MPLFKRILIETIVNPKLKAMSVSALMAKARRLSKNLDNHRMTMGGVNPRTMKIAREIDAVNAEIELRRRGRVAAPTPLKPMPGAKTTGFGDPRNDAPRPQTYGQPGTYTGD